MREVTSKSNDSEEGIYLGAVFKSKPDESSENHWTEQINIGYTPVRFRIDTGTDVTIMNLETFNKLRPLRQLMECKRPLDSPGGALDVVGQFTASALHEQKKYIFNIHVARRPTVSNLLGRETAVEMGFVKRVQQVSIASSCQGTATLKTLLKSILKREQCHMLYTQ